MKKRDEYFMRLAIAKAREGVKNGQTPFGACIVKHGRMITCAHNLVWKDADIIAHAEISAIRAACRRLGSVDLSGCVIYSTCEPCPMCFSACHWARVSKIIYGCRIADARALGFRELAITNKKMIRISGSRMKISGGLLRDENLELFKFWKGQKDRKAY